MLIDEQATILARGWSTTWRAAVASMMMGIALWPMPRRHPILFVGQRRVLPKFLGLWRRMISFLWFAVRRKPFGLFSAVILSSAVDSKFIAPVKLGMFGSPNLFTVVSERKWSFQELWRIMVAIYFDEMMLQADEMALNNKEDAAE